MLFVAVFSEVFLARMKVFFAAPLLLMLAASSAADDKQAAMDAIMVKLGASSELFFSELEKRSIETAENETAVSEVCNETTIIQLFTDLSIECQNFLFEAVTRYEFDAESYIMCESCGSTLYRILQCLDAGSTELELYDLLCTRNENGDTCYRTVSGDATEEAEIFAKCADMACSDECREVLHTSFDSYGCCLYSLVALNRSAAAARDMWAACGLIQPVTCDGPFGGGGRSPYEDVEELPWTGEEEEEEEEEELTTEDVISSTMVPTDVTTTVIPTNTEPVPSPMQLPTSESTTTTTITTTTTEEGSTTASVAMESATEQQRSGDVISGGAELVTANLYVLSLLIPTLIFAVL